jgi:hypothetical protein
MERILLSTALAVRARAAVIARQFLVAGSVV